MNGPDGGFSEEGLWQLVESGRYEADLEAWCDLARRCDGPILDLGCGIGRVCHHLNRRGFSAFGLDRDPGLIADFDRTRPPGSPAGIAWDASALADSGSPLSGRRFGLVIAPQQLVQILGGREARMKLFRTLPDVLEPDGLAAFAICEDLPHVDIHYPGVPPDLREVGEWVHSSHPVAIDATADSVTALRLRQSLGPGGVSTRAENRVTIDRLDSDTITDELVAAGLRPDGTEVIEQTDRHMGSTLILARPPVS